MSNLSDWFRRMLGLPTELELADREPLACKIEERAKAHQKKLEEAHEREATADTETIIGLQRIDELVDPNGNGTSDGD